MNWCLLIIHNNISKRNSEKDLWIGTRIATLIAYVYKWAYAYLMLNLFVAMLDFSDATLEANVTHWKTINNSSLQFITQTYPFTVL